MEWMRKSDWSINRAVGLFLRLEGGSLEHGNFPKDCRRLSRIPAAKFRKSVSRRLVEVKETRIWQAFPVSEKDILRKPDWLAGDAVLIAPVSARIPC